MLLVFYSLASISIGFNILTMAISSWCMIFGPGLAIRGPDGSMSRAVAGMYQERKWALRFFWLGTGQDKRAKFPTSKPHISAVFHSFWLIFGRAIISRNGLEAWMLFPGRARAEHSC